MRADFQQIDSIGTRKLKKNPISIFKIKRETFLESALKFMRFEEWMIWILNEKDNFLVKIFSEARW